MGATLDYCNTSSDLLHRLVAEGLGPLQMAVERGDRSLPPYVTEELRRYSSTACTPGMRSRVDCAGIV